MAIEFGHGLTTFLHRLAVEAVHVEAGHPLTWPLVLHAALASMSLHTVSMETSDEPVTYQGEQCWQAVLI